MNKEQEIKGGLRNYTGTKVRDLRAERERRNSKSKAKMEALKAKLK